VRANNEWHIIGSAGGQNKNRDTYSLGIISSAPLVYRVACLHYKVFIPVKGEEAITITSSSSSIGYKIDFGDGTCDNRVVVSVNGKEKTITVTGDGN
jgi:hypothetical protein